MRPGRTSRSLNAAIACLALAAALFAVGCIGGAEAAPPTRLPGHRRFNEWFNGDVVNGGVTKLEVLASPYVQGVYPSGDVNEGDLLMSVPLNYVICKDTVSKSRYAEAVSGLSDETDMEALFLMGERVNAASRFKPWFDILPEVYTSPIFYSDAELGILAGDPVVQSVHHYRNQLGKLWANDVRPICRAHPKLWPKEACNIDAYKWARSTLDSRGWYLSGKRYLVPMADMFNFQPTEEQLRGTFRPSMRGQRFKETHVVTPTHVEVFAERAMAAGVEAFESYGDNNNDVYFKYHGFVPAVNPAHCVSLGTSFGRADPLFDAKVAVLKALGLERPPTTCVKAGETVLPDSELLMRLVTGMEASDLEGLALRVLSGDFSDKMKELARQRSSYEAAAARATELLSAYPTTAEADEAAIAGGSLSLYAETATRYVLANKRLLADVARIHERVGASVSDELSVEDVFGAGSTKAGAGTGKKKRKGGKKKKKRRRKKDEL